MTDSLRLVPSDPPSKPKTRKHRELRPLAVDAKALARMLCAGLRTIRTWDAAGKIPAPVRIGGRLLWSVAEVRDWLAAGAPCRSEWEARKRASK